MTKILGDLLNIQSKTKGKNVKSIFADKDVIFCIKAINSI